MSFKISKTPFLTNNLQIILNIDGIFLNITQEISVIEACFLLKKQIPSFCYHSELLLEGNCRMCLVELENMPKLQVACCLPIQHAMQIKTNTPSVKKARENILEFLLIQHPLDCPICDQASECDLQDQTFFFGSLTSRYRFSKRSLHIPFYTPAIKLIMTRCINCTRCVRLLRNVFQNVDFGAFNRGSFSEIGTYTTLKPTFEFSGNLVDICPVGALTSKSYAFTFRAWELTSIPSIDLFTSFCIPISFEIYKSEIYRITPRYTSTSKTLWISDQIRYLSLKKTIYHSFIQLQEKKTLITFQHIVQILKILFQHFKTAATISWDSTLDLYSLYLLKTLSQTQLNQSKHLGGGAFLNSFSSTYVFNSVTRMNQRKSRLIVGTAKNTTFFYLNLFLLKGQQQNFIQNYQYGLFRNYATSYTQLALTAQALRFLFCGVHKYTPWLQQQPLIIFTADLYTRIDGISLYYLFSFLLNVTLNTVLNLVSLLQSTATQVGALTLGFNSKQQTWFVKKQSVQYTVGSETASKTTIQCQHADNPQFNFLNITKTSSYKYYGQYLNTDGLIQHTMPLYHINDYDYTPFQILQKLFFQYSIKSQTLHKKFFSLLKRTQASNGPFRRLSISPSFQTLYINQNPL